MADAPAKTEPEPARIYVKANQNVSLGGVFVEVGTEAWVPDGVDTRETINAGIVELRDAPDAKPSAPGDHGFTTTNAPALTEDDGETVKTAAPTQARTPTPSSTAKPTTTKR